MKLYILLKLLKNNDMINDIMSINSQFNRDAFVKDVESMLSKCDGAIITNNGMVMMPDDIHFIFNQMIIFQKFITTIQLSVGYLSSCSINNTSEQYIKCKKHLQHFEQLKNGKFHKHYMIFYPKQSLQNIEDELNNCKNILEVELNKYYTGVISRMDKFQIHVDIEKSILNGEIKSSPKSSRNSSVYESVSNEQKLFLKFMLDVMDDTISKIVEKCNNKLCVNNIEMFIRQLDQIDIYFSNITCCLSDITFFNLNSSEAQTKLNEIEQYKKDFNTLLSTQSTIDKLIYSETI